MAGRARAEVRGSGARARVGEGDLDAQSAVPLRVDREPGVVRVGDRLDDRQAEADTVAVHRAVSTESFERLHELLDRVCRDDRSGIGDGDARASHHALGRDVDVTTLDVVADRIVEEVGSEALDQARVSYRRGR